MARLSSRFNMLGGGALRVAIGITLVYLIVQNWNQLAIDPLKYNIGLILLATLLYPITFGTIVVVWHYIMRLQIGSMDWLRDSRIYCHATLARSLPLGLVWRIGGRVVLYHNENVAGQAVVAASLMEIVLHAAAAVILLLPTLAIRPAPVGAWIFWGALVIVFVAMISLAQRIRRQSATQTGFDLRTAWRSLPTMWRKQGKLLTLILGLNGMTWLVAAVGLQMIIYAVAPQIALDYLDALQIWLITGLSSYVVYVLPFLDVGAKEATMAVVLSAYMPLTIGVALAILYRLIFLVCDIFWPLVGLFLARKWA